MCVLPEEDVGSVLVVIVVEFGGEELCTVVEVLISSVDG